MGTTVVDEARLPAPVEVTDADRERLLELARAALAVAARAAPPARLDEVLDQGASREGAARPDPAWHAAAFVTLTVDGELRGCMGILDTGRPVVASVVEAAACAARTDPRFMPVSPAELPRIEVEVSVLGPMVRIEDPLSFRIGMDGIVLEREGRRGLLLPEVGAMVDFDRVEFLEIVCRKAGLPPKAWRDPRTAVYAFRTDRFGGPAIAPEVATA